MPFLRRRKFVVLVVAEKYMSGQNKPKSNPDVLLSILNILV